MSFEIYRMSKMLSVTPNTCSLPTSHLSQPSPTHRIILCHFLPSGPEYILFRLFCIFQSTRARASKQKVVKENDTLKTKMPTWQSLDPNRRVPIKASRLTLHTMIMMQTQTKTKTRMRYCSLFSIPFTFYLSPTVSLTLIDASTTVIFNPTLIKLIE